MACVAAILIVTLAFFTGAIVLPPASRTNTQTSPQVVTSQATGPILQVQVEVANNPISAGSTQVLIVTVRDPDGSAIQNASVRIEVLSPTGQKASYEGLTDTNGKDVYAWHIIASADNIGTIQVTVSASKSGYQPGQAQTTFEAIQG